MERDEAGRLIREIKPLEGIRKTIAERMTFSKHEYPQGTGQVLLNVDKMMQFRKELLEKKGIKVSFGDLYVKAAACAVEENMALNASRQKEKLIYYDDINLSVMATINGFLMEPVIEHADQKDIEEISAELKKTYENLRKGKLMKVKLEGGPPLIQTKRSHKNTLKCFVQETSGCSFTHFLLWLRLFLQDGL